MKHNPGSIIWWKAASAWFFVMVVCMAAQLSISTEAPTLIPTPLPSAAPMLSPEPADSEVFNPSHVWTAQVLTLCESVPVYGRPDDTSEVIYTLPKRSYVVPREWLPGDPGWLMIQPAHYIKDDIICPTSSVDWWALKRPR